MEKDALFDLLRQQGFRHFDTSDDRQRSVFEWRVETIVIPHPSGAVYSLFELMLIEALLARQTDQEVSIISVTQTATGDFVGPDALGETD